MTKKHPTIFETIYETAKALHKAKIITKANKRKLYPIEATQFFERAKKVAKILDAHEAMRKEAMSRPGVRKEFSKITQNTLYELDQIIFEKIKLLIKKAKRI